MSSPSLTPNQPISFAGSPTVSPEQIRSAGIQCLLDEATRRHRAGNFTEAAQIYGQILKIDSCHADSLHLLGMVAHQAGMSEMAITLIGKAIAINGQVAAYYSNLGTVFQAQGKLEEATACYSEALTLDPNLAEIHLNLGLILQIQGKLDDAIVAYRQAVELKPTLAEAHSNLGNALQTQGKSLQDSSSSDVLDEAVQHYHLALELKPQFPEACYNLGNALQAQGKLEESAAQYEQALALKPQLAEAHCNLGNVLQALGKQAEAEARYLRAVQLKPDYAEAYYNLGNLLASQDKPNEAVLQFERALLFDPGLAKAHNNLGNVFRSLERPEDAVVHYRQVPADDPEFTDAYNNLGLALLSLGRHEEAVTAIHRTLALKPHLAEAHCNLGAVLHAQNRTDEALESYERALALKPDLAKAGINRGLIQLLSGNFEEGWKSYELRWNEAPLCRRPFSQPQWRGEPLNGARILLHAEQGLGDTLQFIRYAPIVQAAGGTVILEVQDRLVSLAAELPGIAEVVRCGDPLPAFDWHCPLLSLPLAFGTVMDSIPAKTPYLFVPQTAQKKADALAWPTEGRKVGLNWAGNPTFAQDRLRFRSIPLDLFRPLAERKDLHLFSLQVGEAVAQLAGNSGKIVDLSPYVSEMADTAAQIAHLDLVITADTSVAHLAAGLGIPTWVLIPYTPDWRWLQERSDCPWYPSMRLFRQTNPGDWMSVIQRILSELDQ
jgi:tetratricopeptide (TPR) repeat protein